jgi:hypothetical protein
VDGGLGGTDDSAVITIRDASDRIVFQGTAAPPGQFPGSDQATGNNTAYPETEAGRRMVGKGSMPGTIGGVASYAYIVRCKAASNADAPFEVRFGLQVFRLTSTSLVGCTDDRP